MIRRTVSNDQEVLRTAVAVDPGIVESKIQILIMLNGEFNNKVRTALNPSRGDKLSRRPTSHATSKRHQLYCMLP